MKSTFNFTRFKQYLEGIAGGNRSVDTSTAIARDLQTFYSTVTPRGSKFLNSTIMNRKALEEYYNHIKGRRRYKPTTTAEKLRRLSMAIGFVIHENADHQHVYIRGSQLRDTIKQWVKSLAKNIAIQRQKHSMVVIKKLPNTRNPITFLERSDIINEVQESIRSLKKSFDISDIKIVTAYGAALLLYGNCQRSGVVQNLTTEEFQQRETTSDGMVVISCLNHKTGAQGRAILVISPSTEQILTAYKTLVRDHLIPVSGCENLFFLTPSGSRYTQVHRKICEAVNIKGFEDNQLPPPSEYRILMSTKAAKHLDDTDLRKVQKHLSHSEETSRRFYEFTLTTDATQAHRALRDLVEKELH